jgi:hypothetical protein
VKAGEAGCEQKHACIGWQDSVALAAEAGEAACESGRGGL